MVVAFQIHYRVPEIAYLITVFVAVFGTALLKANDQCSKFDEAKNKSNLAWESLQIATQDNQITSTPKREQLQRF